MIQKGIRLYFYISLSFAPPSHFIGRDMREGYVFIREEIKRFVVAVWLNNCFFSFSYGD